MPGYYSSPSKNKNFFQNYSDHVDALEDQFSKKFNQLKKSKDFEQTFDLLANEALARLNIFESLKDGHDYADELVGATAIPAMALIASAAFLGKGIYEAGVSLLIGTRLMKGNGEVHVANAQFDLAISALAFALSLGSFLKSAISIVTRPLATLFMGFAEQKGNRFLRENAIDKIESAIDGFPAMRSNTLNG